MKNNIIIVALIAFLFSTQINAAVWNSKKDFQSKVCHVTNGNEAAKYCKNGNVMLYQPKSFGNEQLPIIISSVLCDFKSPVVYNVGGVSCIFTDLRKANWEKFGIVISKK